MSEPLQVEMLSHYGQEHFCPLSLVRVLGASMMEVYEESRHMAHVATATMPPPVTLPPSEGFGQGTYECNIDCEFQPVCMGDVC